MVAKQFQVWYVNLDPAQGKEIKKTRPCIIISPDSLNKVMGTVLVAPLTSTLRNFPFRIDVTVKGKQGQAALDQIRAVDKSRLINNIATISIPEAQDICEVLQKMFEY